MLSFQCAFVLAGGCFTVCALCVCVLSVSPTVSRSLLIPRKGFPSNNNTFRLGSRLRDAGRLTERGAIHMKTPGDDSIYCFIFSHVCIGVHVYINVFQWLKLKTHLVKSLCSMSV